MMVGKYFSGVILGAAILVFSSCLESAQALDISSRLLYTRQNRGDVPIPPAEKTLQTVSASNYFRVTKENHLLGGSVFDKNGNLIFADWTGQKILRLTPSRHLSTLAVIKNYHPFGLSFGPDGRLYIAAYAEKEEAGGVYALNLASGALETIISPEEGYVPKNLFFNRQRGFYFTDYKGTPSRPTGGVYYMAPDLKTISCLADHLASPDGVLLSPDQKTLFVTESGKNSLHRIGLETPVTPKRHGWNIPYHFDGLSPGALTGGSDGNIYVAMEGQGRVLVLNANGLPIGQILVSGRTRGHNLFTASVSIKPNGKALYILTSDQDGGWGASISSQTSFGHGRSFEIFDPEG